MPNPILVKAKQPVFTVSNRGKPVIVLGPYRYNRCSRSTGTRARWTCVKKGDCKVALFTYNGAVFCLSRFGKPVIQLGRYRYNKYHRSAGPRARWTCARYPVCKASLMTVEDEIVLHKEPVFGVSRYGKPVLQLGRYRYNNSYPRSGPRARWKCARYPACPAYITTVDNEIIVHNKNHTH
ncbi:hypothetical protein JYU34_004448 [Plutella xylostella]|uniref:FLYWCH-type domain-containing protein n=1 Tax=Plutella xylostella TaxID=51655 RepID=A0ABQ7QY07_PLUXY|nr:hypothetical protein JYU34_004448 [Plutella xylostella]